VKQCLLVIPIHMLDYPLLGFAKRIPDEHGHRLDPEDLPEPSDEARSLQSNPIEREVVRLEV
jgi:hypothetical protein